MGRETYPEFDHLSLKDQFSNPKIVETEDGNLEIHTVSPEKISNEIPVIVASGAFQGSNTLSPVVTGLAEKGGRKVIFPDLPHGNPSSLRDRTLYTESEYHHGKAMTLVKTLQETGVERADVVAHSEGCINAVFAAALYPEHFRNIVLMNPAGIVGEDNLLSTAARFLENVRFANKQAEDDEKIREQKMEGESERQANFYRDKKKTYESSSSITTTQLEQLLATVKAQGIKITIIATKDDKLFPLKRIQKMNERYRKHLRLDIIEPDLSEEDSLREMVDVVVEKEGAHNDFYLKPEWSTEILVEALDKMQNMGEEESKQD